MIKIRNLTEFEFYKNTPLVDLKNTIYFKSNEERDNFFSNTYDSFNREDEHFNFIKDRGVLKISGDVKDFKEVNYCRFKSDYEPNIWYYCFIPEYRYINEKVIELHLLIDGIMTFCQGDVLNNLVGVNVIRQHLNKKEYNNSLEYLKNNDDVINTYTKKYFYKEKKEFLSFNVLIHSSVSLFEDFGDVNNPLVNSSSGGIVDDISSPVDLYLIDELKFNDVMDKLKKYPWITQNFKKIVLIPKEILNKDMADIKYIEVTNPKVDLSNVYKITKGITDNFTNFLKDMEKSNDELLNLYGLEKGQDEHILRDEYTTIELYNWTGQSLLVNPGYLKDGLKFKSISVGGYENELAIYIADYKSRVDYVGSFLNDSITFNTFDDIPILIDSYNLALAKSSNVRQYAESNLLTNKVKRIVKPDNSLQDRLVSTVSILSNISPMKLGQGLIDEHEYYRRQQAEFKDLSLNPNEITSSNVTNGLVKKNNVYGISLLLSKPSEKELEKIKNYYKLYGFDTEGLYNKVVDTRCMNICNYLEIKGNYVIPKVERSILDMIKIQLENGVRFWHNKNVPNPFIQNISNNKIIK